jgi:pyridoxal phosphate enzyme (YggS family)
MEAYSARDFNDPRRRAFFGITETGEIVLGGTLDVVTTDKMATAAAEAGDPHALADLGLTWHCIGPVQGNKTRLVAEHFDWVHSVDRLKIAQRLSDQRPVNKAPLNVCIQVNIDGGAGKAGVAPHEAMDLAKAVAALPRLRLRGLMTIPEPAADFAAALAVHQSAKQLFDGFSSSGLDLDTLSMGMSADLEAAIHAGSTMVRVGSAIFGGRA